MGVLAWWLLPLLATVGAIVWLWWQGRTGAGEPGQMRSSKELDRMRRAIEKPLPQKVPRIPEVADQAPTAKSAADEAGTEKTSGAA